MPSSAKPRGRPRTAPDGGEIQTIQALDRALGLLKLLADRPAQTLSQLAEGSGLAVATVFRALATLQAHGMVECTEPGSLWSIGAGAYRIGAGFLRQSNLAERAQGALAGLASETGESAGLGIRAGGAVFYLTQVESESEIRASFIAGKTGALHASAMGKALLSHLPEDQIRALMAEIGMPRFTSLTHSSDSALVRDLARSRERGFTLDDQEAAEGMRAIAAPVFNQWAEVVAAVAVAAPAARLSLSDATRLGPHVRAAADGITAATGGVIADR